MSYESETSGFDVNAFKNSTVDEPILDTRPSIPLGRWQARIAELDSGADIWSIVTFPDGRSKATSPRLELKYEIFDPAVLAEMGRTKAPIQTQSYWLTLKSGTSALDPKNNSDFGQLLKALGVTAGSMESMLMQLPGAGPLYVTIAPDKKDPKYSRVVKVEKI